MNNTQQNKLRMAEAVQLFFTTDSSAFSQNSPLQDLIANFSSLLESLQNNVRKQATDTTAHTDLKDANRESLIKHIIVYSNAASVYFSDKNSVLAKQFKISKSKLLRQTGVELKAFCNNIYNALDTNIDVLNPQYVTPQNLVTLQEKINLFDAKTFDVSTAKGDVQNATESIRQDLKSIASELKKIDQLMLQYTLTDNELHNRYRIARKTANLGKSSKQNSSLPPSK